MEEIPIRKDVEIMGELNDLVKQIHETAKGKGWWDEPRGPLEVHALIHSEISEATEAVREGLDVGFEFNHDGKPDGHGVELMDAVIRIADYFGQRGWDFEAILKAKMEYNKTRAYRHGGKRF